MSDYDHDPREVYDQGRTDTLREVEAWLKARRDGHDKEAWPDYSAWFVLDDALDDLREHMHTGTPLTEQIRGSHHKEQG